MSIFGGPSPGHARTLWPASVLLSLLLWAFLIPGSASATVGKTTEQALYSDMGWYLTPHSPLGGHGVWFTSYGTFNKFYELNEELEQTAFFTTAPPGTQGIENLTQGPDGNLYWTFEESSLGVSEVGFIGKYVKSTGATSYINLPTSPGGCGLNPEHVVILCNIELANGPENTLWYAKYRQYGKIPGGGKIGRIKVKESGPPATEYNVPTGALPSGIIEGGGSRMWFIEMFGGGELGAATWKVAKSTLNAKGELEVTDFPVTGKLTNARLVPESGENVFLFENWEASHAIYKITPAGVVTEVSAGAGAKPQNPALGPDGNIWFVEEEAKKIGRLTPSTGVITRYSTANPTGCSPFAVIRGFGESKMLVRENCPTIANTRVSVVSTK